MWDLPVIQAMNEKAATEQKKRRQQKKRKAPIPEPWEGKTCAYCDKPAANAEEYHDIFSDDPKGHIFTCQEHYDEYRGAHEGYFHCEGCGLYLVENYTWENYYVVQDGGCTCLKCAFDAYVSNKANWITKPKTVSLEELKDIPHLIAVQSTYWEKRLVFVKNAEFDSCDGHQISGESLTDIVAEAIKKHGKCIVLLDAGYQFAVSFGVYVPRKAR